MKQHARPTRELHQERARVEPEVLADALDIGPALPDRPRFFFFPKQKKKTAADRRAR